MTIFQKNDTIKKMITKENKEKAIALTQVSKNDVGSPQAQISILTARIKEVTAHLKENKHDSSRFDSDGWTPQKTSKIS